jgi:hypothetical protein
MKEDITAFLDDEGKVKIWPSKMKKKLAVLEYIADKFEPGKDYTEKEVNAIINEWHTFGDYFILRRGMADYKLLNRTKDGSRYWKGGDGAELPDDPSDLCARIIFEPEDE